MPRIALALLLLDSALAIPACGRATDPPPAPLWIDLARGHNPPGLEELAARLESRVQPPRAGRIVRGGTEGTELWFELPLPRDVWTVSERGLWHTPVPAGGALLTGERSSAQLMDGDRELTRGISWLPGDSKIARPDCYAVTVKGLLLSVPPGSEPSERIVYRARLDLGRETGGIWRAAQRDLACNGFLVVPGEPVRIAVEIPPASRLCFASVSPDPDGRGPELGPTTFRVRLDGRPIFEHAQSFQRPLRAEWNAVELGTSGAHKLSFEIDGPAPALFGTPELAPIRTGRAGERPWKEARPDLVLVLCDTFRADNLAAWGGKPELAPHLNRFVERSLRFLDTRAAAAWTLPSTATILTGLFPGQHGATDYDRGVADEVETIAEVLARAGYRTAAVTDSGFLSRYYGQDQGFEWYEEIAPTDWSLEDTLAHARALMTADDGRPLFLLVHTYRVHGPMRSGPEEDGQPFRKLSAEIRARMEELKKSGHRSARTEVLVEYEDEGWRFYEDAVADLDRKVGAWIEELDRDRFFERGRLVLTADHGNAQGEHREFGHGSTMYDVKLRVPLAIAGKGIEPRAVPGVVSLVDLAPTMAALAGVEPSPTWVGRSLLGSLRTDPIYAFDFKKEDREVALYSDGKKLLAPDIDALRAGQPSHAFDLTLDPKEESNLAGKEAWPAELARRLAGAMEPLVAPIAEARKLELPTEVRQQLQDIGYGE